jgi:hypothetical protein
MTMHRAYRFSSILIICLFAFTFSIIYLWLFCKSLNPDQVNIRNGKWIHIFTFNIKEGKNKENNVAIFYRKVNQNYLGNENQTNKEETPYEFVIMRNNILPFKKAVISPIYRPHIKFSKFNSGKDTNCIASISFHPTDLNNRQLSIQSWGAGSIIMLMDIYWQPIKGECTGRIGTFEAQNVGLFGGKVSADYWVQSEIEKKSYNVTMDCKTFFEGAKVTIQVKG